jgi:hypothetical protein
MTELLLLAHHLAAVFLLGAMTHQAAATLAAPGPKNGFVDAFRRVSPGRFASPIALCYAALFVLGTLIYPAYRVHARAAFLDANAPWAVALFELKEHFAAVGLGVLPVYVSSWRGAGRETRPSEATARRALTLLLACIVWWNFLVGHVLVDLKGI